MIVPCGIPDKQVTSLEKEMGHTLDMEIVKEQIKQKFTEVFESDLI
jgi:lipoyl(octanoyl) transferase